MSNSVSVQQSLAGEL